MRVGTDPEFVLVDRDNNFIPAIGILGHGKNNPMEVEGGFILEDGVMVELNTEPASTKEEFVKSIQDVKKQADAIFNPLGLSLKAISSAKYDKKYLDHPLANESGCAEDYCIYNKDKYSPNKYPPLNTSDYRFAGGHLHVEDKSSVDDPIYREFLISCLDATIKLPLDLKGVSNSSRGSTYGRPGTYRPKPYGLEYRTPDNIWLQSNESIKWVFQAVEKAKKLADGYYDGRSSIFHNIYSIIASSRERRIDFIRNFSIPMPAGINTKKEVKGG